MKITSLALLSVINIYASAEEPDTQSVRSSLVRKKQRALKRKPGEAPAWNGWESGPWGGGWGPKPTHKPTKSPVSAWETPAWNGKWNWDGNKWNWSWGGGWGPTKKPTSWDSSWSSGKGPSSWVTNGWGGDAWAGNGWGSKNPTVASDEPSFKPSLSLEPSSNKPSLEPSASLMPSLPGYFDYLYEEFCLDLVFEPFPYVAFESNSTQALNDPHGYCAEKCNNCVFAEGLVPKEQFRGIVHEVFGDQGMGCGCQYDVAVYDNGTFNGTCAYNDPEFWFEQASINGTGPVFQGPLPVRRELAPNNNSAWKGRKFWFGTGSSTLSQEGGDEDDLACYQWIARATD